MIRHLKIISYIVIIALCAIMLIGMDWGKVMDAETISQDEWQAEINHSQVVDAIAFTPEEPTTWEPEPYNDPDIPDEIEAAAEAAAEAYDFEPEFLEAIAFYESAYNTQAVNGGCCGLMQVSTYWHADRMERLGVTESQIWEAGPNMMVAADYLRELYGIHSDPYWVLMTYNGDSRADAYLEGQASPSEYALLVMDLTFELRNKHGKL